MEAKGVGRRQGGERSRGSPCSRAVPLGRVERVSWDRANCFNKAAAERRTVVESGN